jgi:hypothetical protein
VWIDHGVVAGAEVAGVLACTRQHTVAADIAHLVLPVVAAPTQAHPRAVCNIRCLILLVEDIKDV